MDFDEILSWLMDGDVSIQYQTKRDLLGDNDIGLQNKIHTKGWGKQFLEKRKDEGHWGDHFYQPKWISSHYTLLDLKNLGVTQHHPLIKASIDFIIKNERGKDGGVNPKGSTRYSDVCVNGMFLNYACYFKSDPKPLENVIDFILGQHMEDGGFNCQSNRSGARHSSLHSTISVLEGFYEYLKQNYTYRQTEVESVMKLGQEFILIHKLFLSDRTGDVIHKDFLKFPYPSRWKYDILRCLDHFQHVGLNWDERLMPSIEVLMNKRNKDGTWNVQAKHPGQLHFEMEKAGKPSRWNTLRAIRVLLHFKPELL